MRVGHGTVGAYCNHHCRCEWCRAAWRAYHQVWRDRQAAQGVPDGVKHGDHSTYSNYSCRCEPCRDANREWSRQMREQRRRAS